MKNIIKKSIQNSSLSNQISLFLGQAFLLACLMLVSFASAQSPEGTWKFTPSAGAFMVGPNQGTGDYFTSSAGDVTTRDCLFDDEYVFNADGSFENVLGSDTWLEGWQGVVPDACGTPIAPHDGSNAATWSYSSFTNTITIVGDGAFLGLAKAHNTGEDGSPVDDTITYEVSSITSTNMTIDIQINGGAWWRFLFTKEAAAGSDATLSDLQVDSASLAGFGSVTTTYTYAVPTGSSVPQITAATTTDTNAQTVITQATTIPGDATVLVTAQDGTTTQTYSVSYEYGPATPPVREAGDVISIFSEAYTNITGTNFNPNWSQTGNATANTNYTTADGNTLLYYPNFDYQGIDFAGNPQDASNMEYLHLDVKTPGDPATFILQVTPINNGTGVADLLLPITYTTGTWSSVDIPIGDFTGMTWDSVFQLKFDGGNTSDAFFVDNIYFWKEPAAAGTDATLSDLQVDSATLTGFSSGTTSYTYGLVDGTATVPQITAATTTDANAQTVITQATSIPGDATVVVTAQDGTTTETYTVSYYYASPATGPTAPPARDADDVISIFSDAYTNITVTNYNPDWGQSGYSNANTSYDPGDGNTLLAYPNFNYQGIDFVANTQDASSMEYLHLDLWTPADPNATTIQVTPINAGTGAGEALTTITFTTGTWTSVDIPIASFTGMTWDAVKEMKFAANGVGSVSPVDIYLDNVYFWKPGSEADASLSDLQVDSATISGFASGVTSYTYEVAVGASTPQITAATTTNLFATTSITQATSIPGDATVVVTATDGSTTRTYTVSYLYSSPTTGATAPPSRYAGDVISIFGDTYTNVAIDNYNPNWGQAGYGSANTSYDPGDGSTLLYYPNFNYQGIQLVGGHDASDMEYLHVDLWTLSTSAIKVSPINSGTGPGDALQTISHSIGSWTSVDIPIGDFTGMTWDNVIQMKFDGGNATTDAIYVDNIYFWKSSACSSTTIWDGATWSNGVPDANAYAIINGAYSTGTDGDLATCVLQVDANLTLDSTTGVTAGEVLVTAGNTLTIGQSSSLTVSGDLTNSGTVTLNSTADDFSSLIVEGSATGDITYNRFVNSYNDGFGGGWDLVGSPTVMTITDFTTANGANIQVLGDDYAFSQYDNAIGDWIRYETASQTGSFTTGQGYSMATVEVSPPPPGAAGATVAFTGAMQTTSQSINVINNNGLNGVGRRWNLVSNPFPSYINGNTAAGATNFIDTNLAVIDGNYGAVYGWNGSSYTIYNLLDGAFSIAPGQGFWIAAASESEVALDFTAAMRTTTGSGDFVTGPQPLTYYVGLKLYNGETQKATTDFYFRSGLSLGLDSGYDAGAFNQSTKLSTRLPQGSNQTAFARNAMGMDAMQNTRVPLEIRQNAGQAFTISIEDMELPEDIYVYLEDTANGTLTSLKDADFELTAQSDLSGVDRFFIVFKSNSVLSSGDTLGIDALNVYKANTDSFVTIAGITPDLQQLEVRLFSMLGVAVKQAQLNTTTATQTISTDGLASGLYMVQIKSGNQTIVKKIIVK
ncbi:T9SS type A sorting domain-containing protein [Flavobacteriaceae bacterium]|nr:T9SS type A sorting domain-containing protein [Flavobacteriaceae bacterium]